MNFPENWFFKVIRDSWLQMLSQWLPETHEYQFNSEVWFFFVLIPPSWFFLISPQKRQEIKIEKKKSIVNSDFNSTSFYRGIKFSFTACVSTNNLKVTGNVKDGLWKVKLDCSNLRNCKTVKLMTKIITSWLWYFFSLETLMVFGKIQTLSNVSIYSTVHSHIDIKFCIIQGISPTAIYLIPISYLICKTVQLNFTIISYFYDESVPIATGLLQTWREMSAIF